MLTSKQRSKLRSLAATLSPIAQIGKDGLNANLVKSVSDCLDKHELIKVQVLDNAPDDALTIVETLAAELNAIAVTVIGRKGVLYRRSNLPKVKHIDLN